MRHNKSTVAYQEMSFANTLVTTRPTTTIITTTTCSYHHKSKLVASLSSDSDNKRNAAFPLSDEFDWSSQGYRWLFNRIVNTAFDTVLWTSQCLKCILHRVLGFNNPPPNECCRRRLSLSLLLLILLPCLHVGNRFKKFDALLQKLTTGERGWLAWTLKSLMTWSTWGVWYCSQQSE